MNNSHKFVANTADLGARTCVARLILPSLALWLGVAATSLGLATTAEPKIYQEGQQYELLQKPVAGIEADGRVEVLEVFSYICSHCADLQPVTERWSQKVDRTKVHLIHLPVVYGESGPLNMLARGFYASEILKGSDNLHASVFRQLWKWPHGSLIQPTVRSLDDVADIYSKLGIDPQVLLKTARSPAVEAKVKQTREMILRMQVSGTPEVIVGGKYRVVVNAKVSQDSLYDVVDYLVAKIKAPQ